MNVFQIISALYITRVKSVAYVSQYNRWARGTCLHQPHAMDKPRRSSVRTICL